MCGILGIFRFNGREINKDELKLFTSALNHRGPDESGIYMDHNKKIGLGHTRTRTFDLTEFSHQPMEYFDGRYWITFNGDIYNFIELKEELKSLGCKFKSNGDTEVILAAYAYWGEKCQFKFNGDWAFAIWDNKSKNLFLSCDRFGAKPLYYINEKNYFIFASELKAFMFLKPELKPEFDNGFLLWHGKNMSSINTLLKNVFLLSGGFQININENKVFKLKRWWKTIDNLVNVPKKYEDQVSLFKDLFFNSCKIRLRSDVPIASSLSGGVDSSSIVSTISKIREDSSSIERYFEKTQNVFICEFSGDKNSEKHFANDVIYKKKTNTTYVNINSTSVTPEDLVKTQFNLENIDVDSIQFSLMYKKLREKGIRISIDGNTPDETLGGFWEDPEIAMKDSIWPWSDKERFKDLESIRKKITNYTNNYSKFKVRLKVLLGEKNFKLLKSIIYNKSKNNLFDNHKYDLINKSKLVYPEQDNIKHLDFFNTHLYEHFHYTKTPNLLQKIDKLSMAQGVSSRSPFIDPNLVTYIFSLPSTSKIGKGFTKRILRDAMRGLVPESVLLRTDKRGFTSPPDWYGKNMKEFILDKINSKEFLESNIFDGKKIKTDYQNNQILLGGNSDKYVLRYIYVTTIIESFKQFMSKTKL